MSQKKVLLSRESKDRKFVVNNETSHLKAANVSFSPSSPNYFKMFCAGLTWNCAYKQKCPIAPLIVVLVS